MGCPSDTHRLPTGSPYDLPTGNQYGVRGLQTAFAILIVNGGVVGVKLPDGNLTVAVVAQQGGKGGHWECFDRTSLPRGRDNNFCPYSLL